MVLGYIFFSGLNLSSPSNEASSLFLQFDQWIRLTYSPPLFLSRRLVTGVSRQLSADLAAG
jgi:hypothetical protein